jgi:hypothetical protein
VGYDLNDIKELGVRVLGFWLGNKVLSRFLDFL